MLLRENIIDEPRKKYKEIQAKYSETEKGKAILEWKDWVKRCIITTPIMEIPDCDWGKDYQISPQFIEFLNKRSRNSHFAAKELGIEEKHYVFGDVVKTHISETIRKTKVQPTEKPKLIFVFNRLNGSAKKFNAFIGSRKLHSPYIQELKDAGLIGENSTYLHINPHDEIEYNYFGRKYDHLNKDVRDFKQRTNKMNEIEKYEEYAKIDSEKNPILKYEARLYTNQLHVAYYQRNLLLNKFLNTKGKDSKPPVNIVYEYAHKNIYGLMCILQNYNLTNYEVKFYFPHLDEDQYKRWIVHNFVENRRFIWPNAVGTYIRAYINILLHTLMIRKAKKYNIEILLGTSDKNIFHIPKEGCGSFENLQIDNRIKKILQFTCKVGDIRTRTQTVNFQYDINNSPEENLKHPLLETIIYSNEHVRQNNIQDALYLDMLDEYDKVYKVNKVDKKITAKEFINEAIEKLKNENAGKTGVTDPKIVILYGPPASGKTKTQEQVLSKLGEQHTILIPKDEIVLYSDYYLADVLNQYVELYLYALELNLTDKTMASIIFNTYFLALKSVVFPKFYNFIELYYYSVIKWAANKGLNIIVEVTGKKISNIDELINGYIGNVLNNYKKEIHAIHQKFSDEYLNNVYRSFSEFRIIQKEDLRNYADNAWINLQKIVEDPKYKSINIYLRDNTISFDNPTEIFERVNCVIRCKSNVVPNMIDDEEIDFINLIENIGCRIVRGAGGNYEKNYGLIIALIILAILFIILKYFSNFWIGTHNKDRFKNSVKSNIITSNVFV